ncbi:MAG TPA: gfo/Idh/MocA family oxidoreductase, partial [Paenibacillus sp.]|nr:gfo/Idh/MocA family oxidoreductase [Paenibacillus sp.]
WEGFQVNLNGSKGRIEMKVVEKSYVNSGGKKEDEGALRSKSIKVIPMFGEAYEADIVEGVGGHGGGDPILLNDLFGEPTEDPYKRAASHVDGAMSILTGIAGNISMRTGLPVNVDSLVRF